MSVTKLLRVKRPGRLAAEAAALLIAVAVAFPLYWMVLSAFKPAGEIQSTEARPWTLAPRSTRSAGSSNSRTSAATSSTACWWRARSSSSRR